MKKKLCCLFCFCFAGLVSQNYSLDSLLAVLEVAQEDTHKVKLLNEIGFIYLDFDANKGTEYATAALDLAKKINWRQGELHSNNTLGNSNFEAGNFDRALSYYMNTLKIAEQLKDKPSIAKSFGNIGRVYDAQSDLDRALEYSFRSLRMKEEIGDKKSEAYSLDQVGIIYRHKKKYDSAIVFQLKALDIRKSMGGSREISLSLNNLGVTYEHMKYFNKALESYFHSLQLSESIRDTNDMTATVINIGKLYNSKKKYDSALIFLQKGIDYSARTGNKNWQLNAYGNIVDMYHGLEDYKNEAAYLMKYIELNETIFNKDKSTAIAEMEVKYKTEKKQQENEMLVIKSEKDTLLAIIALAGCTCLVFALLFFIVRSRYRKKQKEIEFEKTRLEFEQKALRAQMNPHFIFNAINSIQNYILKKQQQEAYDYLAKFAKLIRIVLNNSQEKVLALQQELEMIKLYVELEQLRFNNTFDFRLTIDENVNGYEISVPAMLIQPYIENAIWHGLMNLENERKGILTLEVSQSQNVLKIVIEDNGIGRERAKQYKKEDNHRSVGMKLTEQRLLIMNKMQEYENAKVTVSDLQNDKGTTIGTRVEIQLPTNGK